MKDLLPAPRSSRSVQKRGMVAARGWGPRATPACLACAIFLDCGSSTQLAPTGPHPPHVQEFVLVEFPPPPAQIEEIPEALEGAADCVWVDGYYAWEERRFAWHPGQWVMPAEDCYYAPPVTAWSRIGEPRLYYTPPRWYREDALGRTGLAAFCPVPRTCIR